MQNLSLLFVCQPGRKFVEESLKALCDSGAKIVRLDAFGYATKKPGTPCFFQVHICCSCLHAHVVL